MLRHVASAVLYASLALLIAMPGLAQAAPAQGSREWVGAWLGTLVVGAKRLRLQLTIDAQEDGSLAGELESLDQAPGQPIPLAALAVSDGQLSFSLPARGIRYVGRWNAEAGRFSGVFRQGRDIPLAFERSQSAAPRKVEGLDGTWQGMTRRNGTDIGMSMRVATGSGGTRATFDIPEMLAENLPVASMAREGDEVRFALPTAGVGFVGKLEGDRLHGSWTDGSSSDFRRTDRSARTPAPVRPQTPKPPFPYREMEVDVANASAHGVTLSGTLTLPFSDRPLPAAILISGSGPQDRDESSFGHKPFAVLADHLARRGIAVLRLDDRGTGRSTGRYQGATTADFAADAKAAFRWLAQRPEIDSRAIGFIGHSEGALVGALAAQDVAELAYLVMLAGLGVPIPELLATQQRDLGALQGYSQKELEASASLQSDLIRIASGALDGKDAERAMSALLDSRQRTYDALPRNAQAAMKRKMLDPWFRQFVRYDPAPLLARFKRPLLAMNGSLDRQVASMENLDGIRKATAGNTEVTLVELPGLNHLFQSAHTGGIGEYASLEETMAPAALDAISAWIGSRFVLPGTPVVR